MLKFNLLILLLLMLCSFSSFAQQDTIKTDEDWEWIGKIWMTGRMGY